MAPYPYRLVRSARKTVSVEITPRGEVVVRAPRWLPDRTIEAVLRQKQRWIAKNLDALKTMPPKEFAPEEVEALKAKARAVLPERVAVFARRMGYDVPPVRITAAKKRFGSCSPKNTLNFSCFLMLYPPEAIDYVVVHELAHMTEKNHGKAFYALIAGVMPDYKARRALLKRPPAAV